MYAYTKNGGPRGVTYFRGVTRCVTKCDRGKGSKLVQYSVTYFMDSPLCIFPLICSSVMAFASVTTPLSCHPKILRTSYPMSSTDPFSSITPPNDPPTSYLH